MSVLVVGGMVDDISEKGLQVLHDDESVSLQVINTFKASIAPDFDEKKNRSVERCAP